MHIFYYINKKQNKNKLWSILSFKTFYYIDAIDNFFDNQSVYSYYSTNKKNDGDNGGCFGIFTMWALNF